MFNDLRLLSVIMNERVYIFFQGREQNQESRVFFTLRRPDEKKGVVL